MAKDTVRDKIWDAALKRTYVGEEVVSPDDILANDVDASRKTVRDTLLTMSREGWLLRETNPDGTVQYRAEPEQKISFE